MILNHTTLGMQKLYILLFLICLCGVQASAAWFNWDYTGPDTIRVGANCRATLVWGGDDAVKCLPTFSGQEILIKKLKSISGGYSYGDMIPGGTTITVIYEATDNFGHQEEFSFTIYFADKTAPEFNIGSLPPDITVQCPLNLPNYNVAATDNCTPAFQININISLDFPPAPCNGVYHRTYTATDASGNSTSYIQTITLEPDLIKPVITIEASSDTANCNGGNPQQQFQSWINNHGGAQASDNCGIYEWLTDPPNPVFTGNCNDPVTVHFIVRDFCNNRDTTVASFYVIDDFAPEFVQEPTDKNENCDSSPIPSFLTWIQNGGDAVVTDNCSPTLQLSYRLHDQPITLQMLTDSLNAQLQLPCRDIQYNGNDYDGIKALLPVTFIFTDFCGNAALATAVFFVRDLSEPVLEQAGQDTTIFSCIPGGLRESFTNWFESGAGAIASDNCGPVIWLGTPNLREALDSLESLPSACNIYFSVEFTPTDACGNASDEHFVSVFSVQDTDGPVFTIPPSDFQLTCSLSGSSDSLVRYINNHANALIEDCNSAKWDHFEWITNLGISGTGQFNIGPYPELDTANCLAYVDILFFAKDNCNNFSSDTSRFNTGDNEAPLVLNPPVNITVSCDENIPSYTPQFIDNCDANPTISSESISTKGTNPLLCNYYQFTITKTWTATDQCGNSTFVIWIVTVKDTVAPISLDNLADMTLDCSEEIPSSDISFTDNCSIVNFTLEENSTYDTDPGQCAHYSYTIFRHYIAKDVCQNTLDTTQYLTIKDTVAPYLLASDTLDLPCMDTAEIKGILQSLILDNCTENVTIQITELAQPDSLDCKTGLIRRFEIIASDICRNELTDTIVIKMVDRDAPVIITQAENINIDCSEYNDQTAQIFNDWLTNFAGATANDRCSAVNSFAALTGSYQLNDPNTFPGTAPIWDTIIQCANGYLKSVSVDFVFFDACNNASFSRAVFNITDTIAPRIIYCPADTLVYTSTPQCDGEYTLPKITAIDDCSALIQDTSLYAKQVFNSSEPGNINIPVDPFKLHFGPINNEGYYHLYSSGLIEIKLLNYDGEGPLEFFTIQGEDGAILGQTAAADSQCGNSITLITLTQDQYAQYAADNFIDLMFTPVQTQPGEGSKTVNDICGGSIAEGRMEVLLGHSALLNYSYSIDGADEKTYNTGASTSVKMREGKHLITYYATDCGGNKVQCNQMIFMKDSIAPVIECPGDIDLALSAQKCDTVITVPLPLKIEDNCGLGDDFNLLVPADTAAAWLTFTGNPDLHNFIADDKTYSFTNVNANVNAPVRLNIYLRGNVESGNEFYTIYDEDGNEMGQTRAGLPNVLTGNCNKTSTIYFNIPAARFNQMAADGIITFKAVTNRNFSIPPDNEYSGINPCPPSSVIADGQTDSSSYMFMEMKYTSYAPPSYFATGATIIPLTQLAPPYGKPELRFNAGITRFYYTISDHSENADTCSFEINIRDIVPPVAVCKPAIVRVHPSGILPGILTPAAIDGGSYDNCGIDTMYVFKREFYCADIGSEIPVQLFVVDRSGNIDSCETVIKVEEALLSPSYSLGICDNDTLRLFANLPDTGVFNSYTYEWSGPNGFTSNVANPSIPNATSFNSGSYTLKVSGFGGCTGTGIVQVFINEEINTPIIFAADSTVCSSQNIVISTQAYNGNIIYRWYEGMAPSGLLLDSTVVNDYSFVRPPGIYHFYVQIRENDCVSNPSASVEIIVRAQPEAAVDSTNIAVCEGGSIALGTPISGTGIQYQWSGPNGFTSDLQYPTVISPATLNDAGIYSLIILEDGCYSLPATTTVKVNAKPSTPTPFSNSPVCVNSELILTSNIQIGIDSFIWHKPDGSLITTYANQLNIPDASLADNGFWTLTLVSGGCHSDESAPFNVIVQPILDINIQYTGPVCEGDSVQLFATEVPGASYQWTGPDGFTSGLRTPWVRAAFGFYTVRVQSPSGCIATGQIQLNLHAKPHIRNLTSNANLCQHPEDEVKFDYDLDLNRDSVSYYWTGPEGYSSVDSFPTIPGSQVRNGIYSLVIISKYGCKSDTARVSIQVEISPPQPHISGIQQICSGGTIELTATLIPGNGTYTWQTPQGAISTGNNILSISGAQNINSGNYTVSYAIGNCASKLSDPFVISITQTPAQPIIAGDPTICLGDTIKLETNQSAGQSYQWSGPGGLSSTQPTWIIYPATIANSGNYTLVVSRNGCLSPVSETFQLIINIPPAAPVMSDPGDEICIQTDNTSLTLCVTQSSATPGASYTFYNANTNTPIAGPTNALCANVTDFSSFTQGTNNLYVVATLNGCSSVNSIPVDIIASISPTELANAGADQVICNGSIANLSAIAPVQATGHWTSINSGITITSPSNANTTASNLSLGSNRFVWHLDYNNCKDYSTDTVTIWIPQLVAANKDIYNLPAGQSGNFSILDNDQYIGPVYFNITSAPAFGDLMINSDFTVTYIPRPGSSTSYDQFEYSLCIQGCDICKTASVLIDIEDPNSCIIPNIITPNNDQVNDVLRIPCLEQLAVNKSSLAIFNEWGTQVFRAAPYQNNWSGTFNGKDLPIGTYYYIFDAGDGSGSKKGFLIIKR